MTVVVTAADVAAWGALKDIEAGSARETELQAVVDAVIAQIDAFSFEWPTGEGEPEASYPGRVAATTQAVKMQALRIWKRRESPSGVAGFDGFGVVRVSRIDPDVDALLRAWVATGTDP